MCMQYAFYTHVHACTYIKCKFNLFPVYDTYIHTLIIRALHTERIKYKQESKLVPFKIIITMYLQQSLKLVITISNPN